MQVTEKKKEKLTITIIKRLVYLALHTKTQTHITNTKKMQKTNLKSYINIQEKQQEKKKRKQKQPEESKQTQNTKQKMEISVAKKKKA